MPRQKKYNIQQIRCPINEDLTQFDLSRRKCEICGGRLQFWCNTCSKFIHYAGLARHEKIHLNTDNDYVNKSKSSENSQKVFHDINDFDKHCKELKTPLPVSIQLGPISLMITPESPRKFVGELKKDDDKRKFAEKLINGVNIVCKSNMINHIINSKEVKKHITEKNEEQRKKLKQ